MGCYQGRIAHLVSGDLWGGAEALVFALACEQHRVHPGNVHCIVMNPGQLATKLTDSRIPTTVLDEGRQGFLVLLRAIERILNDFAPGILHSHRQKENLLAALAGRMNSRRGQASRRLTTVHGMPEPVCSGNPMRRSLINLVNTSVLRFGLDAIVGVSNDIAVSFRNRFPHAYVIAIHNGVNIPDRIAQPDVEKRSGKLHLLALGRLVPIKRFDRLSKLADSLEKLRGSRPLITLAGDGPLRSELHRLLRPDAVNSAFRMPGFVSDTNALLHDADALVVTSDHEGIPMAVLEALSNGIPVFGFRVGGLPEIAAPGLPLRLSRAGDVEALASEIARFFTEKEIGSRTLPPQGWTFDIRECAQAYERLYTSLWSIK